MAHVWLNVHCSTRQVRTSSKRPISWPTKCVPCWSISTCARISQEFPMCSPWFGQPFISLTMSNGRPVGLGSLPNGVTAIVLEFAATEALMLLRELNEPLKRLAETWWSYVSGCSNLQKDAEKLTWKLCVKHQLPHLGIFCIFLGLGIDRS